MNYKKYIKDVPDFPKKGIIFKDITSLLENGEVFSNVTKDIALFSEKIGANKIAGPESRGFILGCPVSVVTKKGFIPIRKEGKLPRKEIKESYDLEYGSNTLCMHEDAIKKGDKVLIVDDLLATGGTVAAAIKLIERLGGEVVGIAFLIELEFLKGRDKIKDYNILSLIKY